jgi:hypothetical protein
MNCAKIVNESLKFHDSEFNARLCADLRVSLHFRKPASKLLKESLKDCVRMLIQRDYVGYMAAEVVKKLVEGELIETKNVDAVILRVRQQMNEELSVEDKINEEVRQLHTQHQEEMRRTGASYQEMFKKAKAQIARDRKLILR